MKKILLITLGCAVETALLWLGLWQWHRYEARTAALEVALVRPASAVEVDLSGDVYLLDNQPHPLDGDTIGQRVLRVGHLADGRALVVDQGWVATQGMPLHLEKLAAPMGVVRAVGVWAPFPVRKGWLRGPDVTVDARVLAFLNPARLGVDAGDVYLQLTVPVNGQNAAVVTAPPPAPNPMRHLSYALQWLGMALAFPILVGLAGKR